MDFSMLQDAADGRFAGPEKAKRMLLTGGLVTATGAAAMGVLLEAVPEDQPDHRAEEAGLVRVAEERDSGVPIAPHVSRPMPGSR